jgi:hypothetical protein
MTDWQEGDIDWSMLEGFVRSLNGHVPEEQIDELVRTISDALRSAGVVAQPPWWRA